MDATRSFPRNPAALTGLALCGLLATTAPLFAQIEKVPPAAPRPLRECLATPRETLKTLYYAAVAFDLQPQLMDEAVACLELDPARAADAARLTVELEQTLRILCVPIHGVPEQTERGAVTVFDAEGFRIVEVRGADGLWRFDRDTVERIPTMNRAALARFRDLQAERAALKDEYTDPSATLRRFLLDMIARDFYSAARCLDLSSIDQEERGEKGPLLARQLAFVLQRRGWLFLQEIPNHPSGPQFTWHADKSGRIALERLRLDDGKEAWLFNKKTVRNIPAMYEQVKDRPADSRYVRLGIDLPPLAEGEAAVGKKRPDKVPPYLGSPRALLQGFFRTMDEAETQDSRLGDALDFLDLSAIPQADRRVQGLKAAGKLEAVLRRIHVELSALPDDWNAPAQALGERQGVRVELVRQRDGCWRFSRASVGQAAAFLDKLTAQDKAEPDRAAHLDSARDSMSVFLTCTRRGDLEQAADCLDLSSFRSGTRDDAGPALAFKLRYVIDRLGRVYIQEVPDYADGPRYVFYRGDLGRIVLARKADGPRKGCWLFTPETVALVEPMFRSVLGQPVPEASADGALPEPTYWKAPGLWVRFHVPDALRTLFWKLQLYQWLGLAVAVVLSVLASRLLLAQVHRLVALVLRKSGSVLTKAFVAAKLRPLTWVTALWLMFAALTLLDLPLGLVDALLPIKTFGMAGLIAWFGVQLVDLATGIYTNSELLRPHRSLSDMVVPVSMRTLKGLILLLVAVYVVYQIGEGESLNRFLTGLGVAGLAASLAAQDALKSFFSTLLLIGERSFKLGDKIVVGGQEGVVEQVGFRATRLRTADGTLLTIPNGTIASAPIDNRSVKAFSRCQTTLLLPASAAPADLHGLRDQVRTWLRENPRVRQDKVEVGVTPLEHGAVEVTLDVYLTDGGAGAEKAFREEAHAALLRLCGGEAGPNLRVAA
jgi:MscS family membrane protein